MEAMVKVLDDVALITTSFDEAYWGSKANFADNVIGKIAGVS